MKKLIATTAAFSSFLLAAPSAFAQLTPAPATGAIGLCPPGTSTFNKLCLLTGDSFGGLVGKLITIFFIIAVVIALAFLIFGGIKWIFSGGDKSAVENARNTIVAAIVGLIIVFLSYFILNIVLKFFGIDIGNLVLPTL